MIAVAAAAGERHAQYSAHFQLQIASSLSKFVAPGLALAGHEQIHSSRTAAAMLPPLPSSRLRSGLLLSRGLPAKLGGALFTT